MLTKFNRSFKFAEIRQILRKIRKRIGRQQGAAPPNMFENLHGPNMHSFSYQLRSACGRSPGRVEEAAWHASLQEAARQESAAVFDADDRQRVLLWVPLLWVARAAGEVLQSKGVRRKHELASPYLFR